MQRKALVFTSLAISSALLIGGIGVINQNYGIKGVFASKTNTVKQNLSSKPIVVKDTSYKISGDYIVVDGSFTGTDGQIVDNKSTYKTIQAAVNTVQSTNSKVVTIFVKNGTYKEKISITSPFITIIGENAFKTKITFDVASGTPLPEDATKTYGTTKSASVTVTAAATDFTAKNITFENSFDEANSTLLNKQAVAIKTNSDKEYFENCRFIGNQDTLYANAGRQYFKNCYIEGDVDFIFGAAQAVFETCDIFSLDRGSKSNNGYITAASTDTNKKYGYLFYKCNLLSNITTPGTVSLGRPWHPNNDANAIASVVYRECSMGAHISSKGWDDMSGFKAADSRFGEYKSTGLGALTSTTRKVLTDAEGATYTVQNVLGDWKPQ